MTIMSFTFLIVHDDVTVAEIEGSVDVQPLSRRNPDPEDAWRLENLVFEGTNAAGKRVDVPVPVDERAQVIGYLEDKYADKLADALAEACQDAEERARDAYDEYREDARDRARDERAEL